MSSERPPRWERLFTERSGTDFMIRILMYGILKKLAGTSETRVGEGRVLDVLITLSSAYGSEFRDIVLRNGSPCAVAILVNGAPVRYNVLEVPLREGDVLSLMPLEDGWEN